MNRFFACALPALVLAGCAAVPAPEAAAPPPIVLDGIPPPAFGGPDTCGRAAYEPLVGQPVGDGAALRAAGATFRVIYPGDDVGTDANPARLNVYADAIGTITALDCF